MEFKTNHSLQKRTFFILNAGYSQSIKFSIEMKSHEGLIFGFPRHC